MTIAKEIPAGLSHYDRTVARCHLFNYGVIFLDQFGCPIDNIYETEELFRKYQAEQNNEKEKI